MLRSKASLAARQEEMRQRQPARRGPGRPPLTISGEAVEALASYDYGAEEIAVLLRCCPNTVRHRFADEIERGHDRFCARLKIERYNLAVKPHWPALKSEMQARGMYDEGRRHKQTRARKPRGLASTARTRGQGRTYKPFRNRYPANRKSRLKRVVAPAAPAIPNPPAPPVAKPAPAPARRPWIIVEFAM